jgi:serine/threonine protein kinase
VGEGAFGYVYLAREKLTQQLCAVKVLEKSHIVKFEKTKAVYREKDILMKFATHPNIIKLDCVFQVREKYRD